MIRAKFARMVVSTYALESMVYLTAGLIDRGLEDYSLEGACCKIFGTEAVWRNINDALQIAGGNGFMEDYPYEKALRDSRINMIFEGTNEILRVLVALSGMRDVGRGPARRSAARSRRRCPRSGSSRTTRRRSSGAPSRRAG